MVRNSLVMLSSFFMHLLFMVYLMILSVVGPTVYGIKELISVK